MAEIVHSGKAKYVGASVKTVQEVDAALSAPSLAMLQVPLWVADALPGTSAIEQIRNRKVAVFVREILEGVRLGACSPREAVSAAIAPDFVTAGIVGLSTRKHLNETLSAFP